MPTCSTYQGVLLSKVPPLPKILMTTPTPPSKLYPLLRAFPPPPVQYRVYTVNHRMDPVPRTFTLDIKVISPEGRVDPRHWGYITC